jgi:hypothetical protein
MKQYQHIVVEPEKRGAYDKIVGETQKVFKGADLFKGLEKVYQPKVEGGDPLPSDSKKLVTTVKKRLAWTEQMVIGLLDFEATRDKTNLKAVSDIELDGVKLATGVPVFSLLSLEKRLKEIRAYYDAIPTLDMSVEWKPVAGTDDQFSHGPVDSYRYVKQTSGVVLYEATDKHPAQVKEVTNDVLVGTFKTTNFSGESQPGDKAAFLARIDKLIEAVKKAKMKANEVEVDELKVGKAIFDYIHGRK